jgi:hypothetical protein
VAPSLLPTETTDKYIQDWGKIIPCTKEEFLSGFNTDALLCDCVQISMHTFPYLEFMMKDQELNFKHF